MVEFSICSVTLARIFSVFIPGPLHFLYFLSSHQHTSRTEFLFSASAAVDVVSLYARFPAYLAYIIISWRLSLSHICRVRSFTFAHHARPTFLHVHRYLDLA